MTRHDPQHDAIEDKLPREVADDLRAVGRHHVYVPAAVDDAVLGAARQHLGGIRRRRRRRRVMAGAGAVAAAAVVALGVWIVWPGSLSSQPRSTHLAYTVPEDIDGSGRVDVLDAFALARQLEREAQPSQASDVTQDGRVDQQDVDAIAREAVALTGERGS